MKTYSSDTSKMGIGEENFSFESKLSKLKKIRDSSLSLFNSINEYIQFTIEEEEEYHK